MSDYEDMQAERELRRRALEAERIQSEAVHHGAARWEINADGERVFRWNESEVRDGE